MVPATDAGPASGRLRRLAAPLGAAGLVGAATAALHARDPHRAGSWGFCPFRVVTGWDCPGCGGLRAVNDLTHLDLVSAASSHLLLVLALPALAVGWVLWVRAAATGRRLPLPRWTALRTTVLLGVLLGFTVVRNTPWGAWLASGPTTIG